MGIVDNFKKFAWWGVISQLIVTIVAAVVALIEGSVGFLAGLIWVATTIGPKYGPPPDPYIKYGPPLVTPTPTPGFEILPGFNLLSFEGIVAALAVLFSLVLYLWAIFGWVFWGAILYLRFKDKKQ